jgi:probable HAF family extracellular repeat protein
LTALALGAGVASGQSFTRLDQILADGLSRDGTMVVGGGIGGIGATYWTAQSGYVNFGAAPGMGPNSSAEAASDDGRYIVGKTNGRPNQFGLFRYDRLAGTAQYYGAFSGLPEIYAKGVSADGNVIVGYATNSSFVFAAFYWTPQRGMRFIPGVSGPSVAYDVSSDGRVIVGGGASEAEPPRSAGPRRAGRSTSRGSIPTKIRSPIRSPRTVDSSWGVRGSARESSSAAAR